ncbi:MAG: tetratricopeptide repeat protein [Pyrinomonadaceae bacterium]|nr:tetratricopeptide repeat protein [Pyrinomonadaceae bacterium]
MNMLGDLYARVDEKDEAVKCFTNVAEHYDKQGFSQKAIAIYNKIARLQPNSISISEKLAPLYHQKGSFAEARNHYAILAENYQKLGKKIEALGALRKIAELDPYNTEIYLKLAENYLQENYKDEAVEAYNEAGSRFITKKNYQSAVTVFNHALEIKTFDWIALNGLVSAQIALGNSIEASEKLEQLYQENPYNTDLMLLLSDCYIDQKNLQSAEKVLIDLVAKEPANYGKLLDLVHAYLNKNDVSGAVRTLTVISEHLLVGGKNEQYKTLVDEVLARNSEEISALRLMVRYYIWLQDEPEQKKTLLRLYEIAQANNLVEDEKYALQHLTKLSPHETFYTERLNQLGGFNDSLSNHYLASETTTVVPTFESFENISANNEFSPSEESNNGFNFNETSFENYSSPTETVEENLVNNNFEVSESVNDFTESNQNEFDFSNSISSFEDSVSYSSSEDQISISSFEDNISSLESDNSSNSLDAEEQVELLSPSLQSHLNQEIESVEFYISSGYFDLAKDSLEVIQNQFGQRPEIKKLQKQIETSLNNLNAENGLSEEIVETQVTENQSSTEFEYEQVSDESLHTESENNLTESFAENQVDIESNVAEDSEVKEEISQTTVEKDLEINSFEFDYKSEETESADSNSVGFEFTNYQSETESIDQSDESFADDDSIEITQSSSLISETQPETETNFATETIEETVKQLVSDSNQEEIVAENTDNFTEEDSFDSAFDNLQFGNVPETNQTANETINSEPQSNTGFESFDDFRNDLGFKESEAESYSADYETHFNLGIAYKEMGLMDDAVKEFQDAVKLVSANDNTRRHLQCCHFLGHCFMDKQMPKLALIWFEKGLECNQLNDEEKQALYYEIACAYENDGENDSAFRFFEQIYAVDVEYRDVANKIKQLSLVNQ